MGSRYLLDRPELVCTTITDDDGVSWRLRILGPPPPGSMQISGPVVALDRTLDTPPNDGLVVFPFVPFLLALRPPDLATFGEMVGGGLFTDPGPDPFPPAGDADHGRRAD